MNDIKTEFDDLQGFFAYYPRIAIAFSGGVDSAYLLYAASMYADSVKAYYVKSAFQPQFELEDAIRLSKMFDTDMEIIDVDILSCKDVTDNPPDRCYFCKRYIFSAILEHAKKDGYTYIADGTNASDERGDRPGMKALEEMQVLSPLRLCDITKAEVRKRSKDAGIFTWDKPAYACLATRIPTGCVIDKAGLARTEKAEDYLKSIGLKDFRVRTCGELARLQVREEDMTLVSEYREEILARLTEDYEGVVLDLKCRA